MTTAPKYSKAQIAQYNLDLRNAYDKLNALVFDGELPPSYDYTMTLRACARLTKTWGRFRWSSSPGNNRVRITIAPHLFGTPQMVRTLLHEMCHLARVVLHGDTTAAHGPRWQAEYVEAAARFDVAYGGGVWLMEQYAREDIAERYTNEGDRVTYKTAADVPAKYTLVCPDCEFSIRRDRLTAAVRAATTQRRPGDRPRYHCRPGTDTPCHTLLSVRKTR